MTERELTLQDYMAMLRRRWVLIVVLAVVGAPLAYVVSRFLPDRYKSQTLVLVEQPSIPSDIVRSLDTADITQRLSSMQQQILSRSRIAQLHCFQQLRHLSGAGVHVCLLPFVIAMVFSVPR